MKLMITSTILIITLLTVTHAAELESDIIDIQSNYFYLNEKNGSNFYSGNVRMRQGELQVDADELRVYSNNNILDRFFANSLSNSNSRVRFRHKDEAGKEVIAFASTLQYYEKESRLLLEGDAELTQGTSHIRSNRIEYNIDKQSVIAGEDKNKQDPAKPGRVHMTITPEKNNSQKK